MSDVGRITPRGGSIPTEQTVKPVVSGPASQDEANRIADARYAEAEYWKALLKERDIWIVELIRENEALSGRPQASSEELGRTINPLADNWSQRNAADLAGQRLLSIYDITRKPTTASSVGTEAEGRSAPSIPPVKTGEG